MDSTTLLGLGGIVGTLLGTALGAGGTFGAARVTIRKPLSRKPLASQGRNTRRSGTGVEPGLPEPDNSIRGRSPVPLE
ncbi:MAG TPA: hypothetical protein VGM53_35205 [Streptosporangiaceae bacterium]|jgi:hypothetical protein